MTLADAILRAVAEHGDAPDDPTTRYVPEREPYLTRWCQLHRAHMLALADEDAPAFRDACRIADAKYRVFLESIGAE